MHETKVKQPTEISGALNIFEIHSLKGFMSWENLTYSTLESNLKIGV